MAQDNRCDSGSGEGERNVVGRDDEPRPDRRELIKRLGKAATLPTVVGAFLASDVTVSAAN